MYIKDKFTDKFKGTECEEMEIGYIMPRHGWKGKIMWISDDEDVNQMYSEYSTIKRGNINIHLWCHLPASKPQTSSKKRQASSGQPATKRAKCAENNEDKMNEAGTIYKELMKKHEKNYTVEQLHAWAQLMQIKKHGSLDDPPDYPFFKGRKKTAQVQRDPPVDAEAKEPSYAGNPAPAKANDPSDAGNPVPTKANDTNCAVAISPTKKIAQRGECIQQLQRVGELLQKGIISQEKHDQLQNKIMEDIQ